MASSFSSVFFVFSFFFVIGAAGFIFLYGIILSFLLSGVVVCGLLLLKSILLGTDGKRKGISGEVVLLLTTIEAGDCDVVQEGGGGGGGQI